jgi:hypothetical protein
MNVRPLIALAVLTGVCLSAACSLVNAPEDVKAAAATGAGGGVTTGTQCKAAADCDPSYRCTGAICSNGRCAIGTPPDVDDKNPCTLDSCDPQTGPKHTPVPVDDGNACTADACDPKNGVTHTPIPVDDKNPCTDDSCDPQTGPKHTPLAAIDDGNPCHDNACDPKTGAITHTPTPGCTCAHSVCDDAAGQGSAALDPKTCTFGPSADCVSKVCLKIAACCSSSWTSDCKAAAMDPTVCTVPGGFTCGCQHDFTCAGPALFNKCDPCVNVVCAAMPTCCNDSWTADCVTATQQLCNAAVPPDPNPACK